MSITHVVADRMSRVRKATSSVRDVLWNLVQKYIGFCDAHDHLVGGQHNLGVDGWSGTLRKLAEMRFSSSKKLLRTLHMKCKIAHRPIAKLVLGMHAAEFAVGMWTIVDDINPEQLVVATNHVVEDLSASRLHRQQVDATRKSDDVSIFQDASLAPDHGNFSCHGNIDPWIGTRYVSVRSLLLHNYSSFVWLTERNH